MSGEFTQQYIEELEQSNESLLAQLEEMQSEIIQLTKIWEDGWYCNGDENQVLFDTIMEQLRLKYSAEDE